MRREKRRKQIQLNTLLTAFLILLLSQFALYAQSTAFTYQGRLNDSSTAANGSYDLQFTLYDSTGAAIGSPVVREDVQVTNGIFTVSLDFGASAFDGTERTLEIAVRRGNETGSFTTLSPRQSINSTPYAIRSVNAATADNATNATNATNAINSQQLGGVEASNFLQTDGSGANLTNLNASSITSGTINDGRLSPNLAFRNQANIFTTNQTINGSLTQTGTTTSFSVTNGFVASGTFDIGAIPASGAGVRMMFYPGKAAFRAGFVNGSQWDDGNIGGHSMALGFNTRATNLYSIAMGRNTTATGIASTAMGDSTTASNIGSTAIGYSTIASGQYSTALGYFTEATANFAVAMGNSTTANGIISTAIGNNTNATGSFSTATGDNTTASGTSSISMGRFTTASGDYTTALGIYASTSNQQGSFVFGDSSTVGNGNSTITATAPNQFAARATGGFRFRTSADLSTGCDITSGNLNCTGTISGTINATTQFDIGGTRVLSAVGADNLFAGVNAGSANTGQSNSFFGRNAGQFNTTGSYNSFFGRDAGLLNTTGESNVFVGVEAGRANTEGNFNSFFGTQAGRSNTTGTSNSFFGRSAGFLNTTGTNNSFFGRSAGSLNTTGTENTFVGGAAGFNNTTGNFNSFIGTAAGQTNTTGSKNTIVGHSSDVGAADLNYASAFGANAVVNTSDTIVLGKVAGTYNSVARPADTVQIPGNLNVSGTISGNVSGTNISANIFNATTQFNIGGTRVLSVGGMENIFAGRNAGAVTTAGQNAFFGENAGQANTSGHSNSSLGFNAGYANTTGSNNSFVGRNAGLSNTTGSNNTLIGAYTDVGFNNLSYATAIGAGAMVRTSNTIALGRETGEDLVRIFRLGSAGSTQLCLSAISEISTCSSSLRYKTNIAPFNSGLNLIKQLRPISFDWKDGGMKDIGFGAEDIAAINPLFVIYNKEGQVEGVKYDRLSVVFVNAIKEQQTQIEAQQKQIEAQKKQIEAQKKQFDELKRLVCALTPTAEVCQK